jgi:hypothetical protein
MFSSACARACRTSCRLTIYGCDRGSSPHPNESDNFDVLCGALSVMFRYVSTIVTTRAQAQTTHLFEFVIQNFKAISVVMGPKGVVKREWQGQDCHGVCGGEVCVRVEGVRFRHKLTQRLGSIM